MPPEYQENFLFGDEVDPTREVFEPLADFLADVSRAWDLPLGECVRLRLHGIVPELTGKLKLAYPPDMPFDPRQPIVLRLNGIQFSQRDIASWVLA